MAANQTRTKLLFDKAAGVLLRDPAAVARAATGTDTAVSLSELRSAWWHFNEIPHGVMRVGVQVSDGLFQGSTYALSLLIDDVVGMSDSPVTVAGPWTILAPGYYEFDIDSKSLPALDPDITGLGKWMASKVTVAGTPVAITSSANNGGGKVRLLLGSTAGFQTGQVRTVSGMITNTEANGTWTITVVDATHIDLLAVTFIGVGTGGQFNPQISFGAWLGREKY